MHASLTYSAFDAVGLAASLGGPEALARVLGMLPREFPAAILVAQHLGASGSYVADVLGRNSPLPVTLAKHADPVRPGRVYVAPPDRHLLVTAEHRLELARTPRVKFCRPAAEPLFVSIASAYRERAIGVVLTGMNTDGAIGTQAIKWMGGRVIVQDPASARAAGMPRAAIATGCVDFVLPLERIAAALIALVMARGAADLFRVYPPAA